MKYRVKLLIQLGRLFSCTYLYEAVVLDEDGLARQVAVHDGRRRVVQVVQGREQLDAPALPRAPLDGRVRALGAPQELLERAARHVLGDEDDARQPLVLVAPVLVELDDVGVVEADEVLEDEVDLGLVVARVPRPLPAAAQQVDLVPDDLDAVLGVHGQEGLVDARHVPLRHRLVALDPAALLRLVQWRTLFQHLS